MTTKTCKTCLIEQDIEKFYLARDKRGYTYRRGECKACVSQRTLNRGKDYHWASQLWTKYRIRPDQFNAMLRAQNNSCAICADPISRGTAVVDHDHSCCKTERACGSCNRSLLCTHCNRGLGAFRDNPDYLSAAIEYLVP